MFKSKIKRKKNAMFGKQPQEVSFYAWITDNWHDAGGLIIQATAAKMLNKSTGRISQMIREKKLKEYRYRNASFVSFAEVWKIARQEQYEEMEKAIEAELKKVKGKLPPEQFEEFRNELMAGIKMTERIIK